MFMASYYFTKVKFFYLYTYPLPDQPAEIIMVGCSLRLSTEYTEIWEGGNDFFKQEYGRPQEDSFHLTIERPATVDVAARIGIEPKFAYTISVVAKAPTARRRAWLHFILNLKMEPEPLHTQSLSLPGQGSARISL